MLQPNVFQLFHAMSGADVERIRSGLSALAHDKERDWREGEPGDALKFLVVECCNGGSIHKCRGGDLEIVRADWLALGRQHCPDTRMLARLSEAKGQYEKIGDQSLDELVTPKAHLRLARAFDAVEQPGGSDGRHRHRASPSDSRKPARLNLSRSASMKIEACAAAGPDRRGSTEEGLTKGRRVSGGPLCIYRLVAHTARTSYGRGADADTAVWHFYHTGPKEPATRRASDAGIGFLSVYPALKLATGQQVLHRPHTNVALPRQAFHPESRSDDRKSFA